MDLVKDDKLDVPDEIRPLVEHAAQDLGRHLPASTERVRDALAATVEVRKELTIRQAPSGLIWTSPVRIPIVEGSKVCLKSLNFWLLSALIGLV